MATLGTLGVYEALAEVLAADPDWATLGSGLDYSMVHVYTAPLDRAFYFRFEHGKLADLHEVDPAAAEADYVLTGPPAVWGRVFSKVPKARASGFHLALSTNQIRFTGPFMQTYLRQTKPWEHLLDLASIHKIAAE
jgi:hypothetical protein